MAYTTFSQQNNNSDGALISITDTETGNSWGFPTPSTTIRMVVNSDTDYTFILRCGTDSISLPIAQLNNIFGLTPPAGNNPASDYQQFLGAWQ